MLTMPHCVCVCCVSSPSWILSTSLLRPANKTERKNCVCVCLVELEFSMEFLFNNTHTLTTMKPWDRPCLSINSNYICCLSTELSFFLASMHASVGEETSVKAQRVPIGSNGQLHISYRNSCYSSSTSRALRKQCQFLQYLAFNLESDAHMSV